MSAPSRPAVRWHGGKWKLAPWIISHFPAHRVYVEPFGGGASVLLRKPRAYAEVYNDLDGEVVNLFRVLRDAEQSQHLIAQVALTPFSRDEFKDAYQRSDDPVERARRLLIRSFMGFGSDGATGDWRTGFRANSSRSGTTPAHDWANYPRALEVIARRLKWLVVENKDAVAVSRQHDGPETLHYYDPPYGHDTRSRKSRRRGGGEVAAYRHEMSDAQHEKLLADLRTLEGFVVLSGYPWPLYDEALRDWTRVETVAHADGARPRTEVLWINPACAERLRSHGPLFEAAA